MSQKRKAKEAFGAVGRDGAPSAPVSAFAAARKMRENRNATEKQIDSVPVSAEQKQMKQSRSMASSRDPNSDSTITIAASISSISNKRRLEISSTVKKSIDAPDLTTAEDGGRVRMMLRAGQHVVPSGEYDITVEAGIVEVHGAMLQPRSGTRRVFAISTHAVPAIIGRSDESTIWLSSVASQLQVVEKYSTLFRNLWTSTKDVSGATQSFTLASRQNEIAQDVESDTTDSTPQRPLNKLEIPTETRRLLSSINGKLEADDHSRPSSIRIMPIGAKSTGKSTLTRTLCNSIVTRRPSGTSCAVLDLDPGQPEFGVPGQLSLVEITGPLLGPAFTHIAQRSSSSSASTESSSPQQPPYRLLRAHILAATHFKDYPEHYLACAADLARHIPAHTPVVVNSCGWVSGVGANVLVDLCAIIGITDVPVLGGVEEGLLSALRAQGGDGGVAVHQLPRQASRPPGRSPAELRAMQTMSAFHLRGWRDGDRSGNGGKTVDEPSSILFPRWIDRSVSTFRPWTASYAPPDEFSRADIAAVVSYSRDVAPAFLSEVLEGALVAIVILDGDDSDFDVDSLSSTEYIQRAPQSDIPYISSSSSPSPPPFPIPLAPDKFSCVCAAALIRHINTRNKTFQIIAPALSDDDLHAMRNRPVFLVRGGFDSPDWAYLEDVIHTAGVGAGDRTAARSRVVFDTDVGEGEGAEGDVTTAAGGMPWVSFREPVGVEGAVWRLRHPPTMASAAGGGK